MNKKCEKCKQDFPIYPEDLSFYEKMEVPPPTFCPDCRMQRRMVFRNERALYRRKDDHSGEEIFSAFPKESPVKVYEHDFWWSDHWDPMDYGKDIDWNKPFLQQVKELSLEVPWPSRAIHGLVNSDYSNNADYLKNCYLCFDGSDNEDCLYCITSNKMKRCIDCYQAGENELCYENFSIGKCYKSFFGVDNDGCQDVWFCKSCVDCNDCFGCINLKHKKYHIFNEAYSKEEYEKEIKEFDLGSYSSLSKVKSQVEDFFSKNIRKYMMGTQNVNAQGEYIWHSKNVHRSYQIVNGENIRYCQNIAFNPKDCMDYYVWGLNAELLYECTTSGDNVRNLKFCLECWPACQDLEYCMLARSCSNLFGCIGTTKKQYCILNKQYTKEEYEELVPKIKKHMDEMPYVDKKGRIYKYGEFFPVEMSAFAYNETSANDYLPLSKKEAEDQGFVWRELEKKEFEITIQAKDLPNHIKDVGDSISKEIVGCLGCKRAFRILPAEIEFYKQFKVPLPRLCVDCRYTERIKNRNPLKWYKGKCQCAGAESDNKVYKNLNNSHKSHKIEEHCPNEFETTYDPKKGEIVYCEQCYQAEIS